MEFNHNGPDGLRLGIVFLTNVDGSKPNAELTEKLHDRLHALRLGLSAEEDEYRKRVRDVFRNGTYKPTGRAKPASEYLLRAASEGNFPNINMLVDCCNYLSANSLLPISIWDIDLAETEVFEFRLGNESEEYVFNPAGHSIRLHDLIVGCAVQSDNSSRPIVNAVKDSMLTKTHDSTRNVAAAIYAPLQDGPKMDLEMVCKAFVHFLTSHDPTAMGEWKILHPGETAHF